MNFTVKTSRKNLVNSSKTFQTVLRLSLVAMFIFVIFSFVQLTSGQNSAFIYTSISLEGVPSSVAQGSTITPVATVTDSTNDATTIVSGKVTFYHFLEETTGNFGNTIQEIQSPNINFTLSETTQVAGFKIPVTEIIGNIPVLHWSLLKNGTTLESGDILGYELFLSVENENAIYIIFNSHQTDFSTSSLTLLSGEVYTLSLDYTSTASFSIFTSTNPNEILYYDALGSLSHGALSFLKLESSQTATIEEPLSVEFVLNSNGKHRILAYFSDQVLQFFAPVLTSKPIDVHNWDDLAIEFHGFSFSQFSYNQLSARVLYKNSPVLNLSVNFYILAKNNWNLLASATTNNDGNAFINLQFYYKTGQHEIKATAESEKNYTSSTAILIITPAVSYFEKVKAEGIYGSGSDLSSTSISVSGQVVDENGNGLPSLVACIQNLETRTVNQTITNISGWFQFSTEVNKNGGIYNNYFNISVLNTQFTSEYKIIPLTIHKSSFVVTTQLVKEVNLDNANFTVAGTFMNVHERPIARNVSLYWLELPEYVHIYSSITINQFEFTIHNQAISSKLPNITFNTGIQYYKVVILGDENHTTESVSISISFIKSNVRITRVGVVDDNGSPVLPSDKPEDVTNLMTIEYLQPTKFYALALDQFGAGVLNLQVDLYVLISSHLDEPIWEYLGSTQTNNEGRIAFEWTPDKKHYINSIGIFRVSSNSTQYSVETKTLFFVPTSIPVHFTVVSQSLTYQDNASFIISAIDDNGLILTNSEISVYSNNTLIHVGLTDDEGKLQFNYRFNSVGNYILRIEYSGYDSLHFVSARNFVISIKKTEYSLTSSSLTHSSGETLNLTLLIQARDLNPVGEISVKLYQDGNLIFVGQTNSSGLLVYSSPTAYIQPLGNYTFEWVVEEVAYYNESRSFSIVHVNRIKTSLDGFAPSYSYGSAGVATIKLSSIMDVGSMVANQIVSYTIPELNIINSLYTNSNGSVTIGLPESILPKTYTINAHYSGNEVLTDSSAQIAFQVLGRQIAVHWNTQDFTTYFGSNVKFSFFVKTQNMTPVPEKNVKIVVTNITYTYITDKDGLVEFSETILKELSNSEMTITINPEGGDLGTTDSKLVSILKTYLVSKFLGKPEIQFEDRKLFELQIINESSLGVKNAAVKFFVTFGNPDVWVLLTELVTAENGTYSVQISANRLSPGNLIQVRIQIQHQYYKETVLDNIYIKVVKEQLKLELYENNFTFYETEFIKLQVTQDSQVVPNIPVFVINIETNTIIGNATTSTDGIARVSFYPDEPRAYALRFFTAHTINGYTQATNSSSISLNKAEVYATLALDNYLDKPGITIDLFTLNGVKTSAFGQLFKCTVSECNQTTWEFLSLTYINTTYTFIVEQNVPLIKYQIQIAETYTTFPTSNTIYGIMQKYSISSQASTVEYSDYLSPPITFDKEPSFSLTVDIYVNQSYIGFITRSNRITSPLKITIAPGNYLVEYRLRAQEWVIPVSSTSTLTVLHEKIIITDGNIRAPLGQDKLIETTFTDNDDTPLLNAYVESWVTINDNVVLLGAGFTDELGKIRYTLHLSRDLEITSYELQYSIVYNQYYLIQAQNFYLNTLIPARIDLLTSTPFYFEYQKGLNLQYRVVNDLTGEPLAGHVTYLVVTDFFYKPVHYLSNRTDAEGYITYTNAFGELWDYKQIYPFPEYSSFELWSAEDETHGFSMHRSNWVNDWSYKARNIDLEATINDRGVTWWQDIAIHLKDGFDTVGVNETISHLDLIHLELRLYLKARVDEPIRVWFLFPSWNNTTDKTSMHFKFRFEEMGEYQLSAILNSKNLFTSNQDTYHFSIGWKQTIANFSVTNKEIITIPYSDYELPIYVTSNTGNALRNIQIAVSDLWGNEYSYITNSLGKFTILLDDELYTPVNNTLYTITFWTVDGLYLKQVSLIKIYINVELIEANLELSVKNYYIDESPKIVINDSLIPNQANLFKRSNSKLIPLNINYQLELYNSDTQTTIIIRNVTFTNILAFFQTYNWSIANYSVSLSHYMIHYEPNTVTHPFKIIPIPVKIVINTVNINTKTATLEAKFYDDRTQKEIFENIPFQVTISTGNSQSITKFYPESATFEIELTDNLNLLVTASGNYEGAENWSYSKYSTAMNNETMDSSINRWVIGGIVVVSIVILALASTKRKFLIRKLKSLKIRP